MSESTGFFSKWTGKLTGLVGLLIGVPALINSVGDVWVSWNDLPIGDKEKTNSILFKRHWKESPIHTKQIIIEAQGKQIPITLDVYRNGNIFLDYGGTGQWFAHKKLDLSENQFSLISSAHAEEATIKIKLRGIEPSPVIIVNEEDDNKNIVRSKVLDDGSIEKTTLDPNTAKTLSFEVIPAPEGIKKPIEVEPTEIIVIPDEKKESVELIVIEEP
jgi:hypothetical protein